MKKRGLLVMAYGTPYKEEDIEPYYTHIRHGRKPSEESLQDLKDRYKAIGGISPLAGTTERQAVALRDELNKDKDVEYVLYIGLKHIAPFIEDAVKQMHDDGIEEAVTIVLAPHYSTFSVASYNDRAAEEAAKYGIKLTHVKDFYRQQKFITFWRNQVDDTLKSIPDNELADTVLVVSAHSLPEKIKEKGDPYPDQLAHTAQLISDASQIRNVAIGWQSEGNTPDPWLGPDVQDLTRELYQQHGYKHFIYTPVGFVCEHLEVLYDNDVECQTVCREVGAVYHRPAMPDTHQLFIEAMADEIHSVLNS
ncbi:ferrochelatase [Macrococcus equipercicus]|uniref:Coproporphyrin III ferrochelatase n=1 Tax=Macrococcus equipercicus TaxID=69967 RepID=A0A9Q9BMN7_9STAP|nr:ferrochelatase [Macrococcus equipercicus]UTH13335.1 ferrochelatase [Macrococcus equipercicus]